MKTVAQRNHKVDKEKYAMIDEEVEKLKRACFITEIKCIIWLANMVFILKSSNKWRMCVDFTYLNAPTLNIHICCLTLTG